MTLLKLSLSAIAAAAITTAAAAQAPAPSAKQFVMKAGASDKFEVTEGKLMQSSSNGDVRRFARQMVTDHTKSTMMVKTAAMADGMHPAPPMLTPMQRSNIRKLTAARGRARDRLYVDQQKMAHQQALDLMQSYASGGDAQHLRDTAGQIVPVVQMHIDMLSKM